MVPEPRPQSGDLTGSTLAVVAGSVAALLGTLVARVVMARALAPAELGVLLAAVAVASALGGVLSFGLNAATARRVAALRAEESDDAAHATARTALRLAATVGGGGMVALAAVGLLLLRQRSLLPPSWQAFGWGLTGVAPVVLALPVGLAVLGACRGFGEVAGRALLRDGAGGLLRATAVCVAALAGGSVLVFALAFAVGTVGAESLFTAHGVRRGWFRRSRAGWDRALVSSLRPFAVLEGLGQLDQWLDMAVIGVLANPAQVGFYGVAKGLLRAMRMLASAGAHGYLPLATTAHQQGDRAALGGAYRHARLLTLALVWVPAAVCLVVPGWVVVALAGAPYAPAGLALRLLALALLVDVLPGYMDLTLVAAGNAAAVAWLRTASLALGAIAMVMLTPQFGAAGTAAGLLVMAVGRNALLAVVVWRRLRPGRAVLRHLGIVPLAVVLLLGAGVAGELLPDGAGLIAALAAGVAGAALLWRAAGGSLAQLLRAGRGEVTSPS